MTPLIFFGSDRYSATVLKRLTVSSLIKIQAVVTDKQQDLSPVEQLAGEHGITVSYYPTIPADSITPDTIGLCASFDHLLPKEIITQFSGNLYNLHPSLLPQYRNVSPVQYALALGDTETGITLFRISEGIDNGQIITQVAESIQPDDTLPALTTRLFERGADLFLAADKNNFAPTGALENRNTGKLIFTHRLTRDSGHIEWNVLQQLIDGKPISTTETDNKLLSLRLTHNPTPAHDMLNDLLRALTPWPGVWSNAMTKKGELRISLVSVKPEIMVKIAGKPKPISWDNFTKYYLDD